MKIHNDQLWLVKGTGMYWSNFYVTGRDAGLAAARAGDILGNEKMREIRAIVHIGEVPDEGVRNLRECSKEG